MFSTRWMPGALAALTAHGYSYNINGGVYYNAGSAVHTTTATATIIHRTVTRTRGNLIGGASGKRVSYFNRASARTRRNACSATSVTSCRGTSGRNHPP